LARRLAIVSEDQFEQLAQLFVIGHREHLPGLLGSGAVRATVQSTLGSEDWC